MRRIFIPIAAGVVLGIIVTGLLAYFIVAKDSTSSVDGLGRSLVPAPWPARFIFGASKEWAGWSWFLVDLVWFWGGIGLAFSLGSLAGERSSVSRIPKVIGACFGVLIVLATAYITQRTIKLGVAYGLEAGIGAQPKLEAFDPAVKAKFPLVDFLKWAKFADREQEIYVQGLLETWSFVMYGLTEPGKPSPEMSAFTSCVEKEKASAFKSYVINNLYAFGKVEKAPVDHLFENAMMVCEKYAQKSDGSQRPVRLLGRQDWEGFSDKERQIYLTAYLDFIHFSEQRILTRSSTRSSNLKARQEAAARQFLDKKKMELEQLEMCIGRYGVDGFFNTMSKQQIEWQHPLPWSAAKALGGTCFRTN